MSARSLILMAAIPLVTVVSEAFGWVWMSPATRDNTVLVPNFQPRDGVQRIFVDDEDSKKILHTQNLAESSVSFSDGAYLRMFDIRWDDLQRFALSLFLDHKPEVCLGVSGSKLVQEHPSRTLNVGNEKLVFETTEFLNPDGLGFYVFKCSWANGMGSYSIQNDTLMEVDDYGLRNRAARMQLIWNRQSPRYARTYMVVAYGIQSVDEAWERSLKNLLTYIEISEETPTAR